MEAEEAREEMESEGERGRGTGEYKRKVRWRSGRSGSFDMIWVSSCIAGGGRRQRRRRGGYGGVALCGRR